MRLRIVTTGAVVLVSVVSMNGAAFSEVTSSTRPTSFCGTVKKFAEKLGKAASFDVTDPAKLDRQIDGARKALKAVEKEAPKSLRSSIKIVRKLDEKFLTGDFDLRDERDIEKLANEATKAGKAVDKLFRYIAKHCKIDLTSKPGA